MSITVVPAHPSQDGAGVRIKRVHGFNNGALDPFLMLDEILSDNPDDYIAGFPPHPHRGIETLTYIRHGGFRHQDHMGNTGEISSGGAQWMSAGKGVIHSEMPLQEEGLLHGFQLWINLPAKDKLKAADWKDYPAEQLPWQILGDGHLKTIAGTIESPEKQYSSPLNNLPAQASVADLSLPNGGSATIRSEGYKTLIHVYQGKVLVNDRIVMQQQMAIINDMSEIRLDSQAPAGCLILQGVPLNEPVAHYGPFVMNTEAEIKTAIREYQQGTLTD